MIRFVYVIGVSDNPVKIGVADDPRKRLMLLQIGCPDELTLHAAFEYPLAAADKIERAVHKDLEPHWRRGEWFNVTPAIAQEAIERIAPPLVVAELERDGTRYDMLARLRAHGLSQWARAALGHYRLCMYDRAKRAELERMNSAVLGAVGTPGLEAFKIAVLRQDRYFMAFSRQPHLMERAEVVLTKAVNALCRDYGAARATQLA